MIGFVHNFKFITQFNFNKYIKLKLIQFNDPIQFKIIKRNWIGQFLGSNPLTALMPTAYKLSQEEQTVSYNNELNFQM